MDMEEFPRCCGVDVLQGFGDDEITVYDPTTGEWKLKTNAHRIQDIKDCLLGTKAEGRGLVLAVTNKTTSNVRAAKLLKDWGFKPLRIFRNPRHRSTLTLWELRIGSMTRAQINRKAKALGAKDYDDN